MSYLAGVKKEDLRSLCEDLGLTITSKMSVLDLKNLIINDTKYDEEFPREHLKVDKMDSFDNMKVGLQKKSQLLENRNKIWVKSASSTAEHEKTVSSRNQQFSRKPFPSINNRGYATKQQEDRPPVKCYGCGTSGYIRAKCPNYTAEPKTESSRFEFLEASSCFVTTSLVSTVYLRINGIFGKACADTGSSHSIAGETLYTLLKDEGAKFWNGTMCISLADGQRSIEDVLITTVTLEIEGRKSDQELIALPNVKRNRTLLGIDFLKKSGIMLDLRLDLRSTMVFC
ncbi:retrovirus-related Pol polyprotein from transposon 17.6 [Nephila pilipes]|uniref:Retrovirus-related Pol polyprotein from transposon 17.6 n=1 Tax=Nephila pilipes TaxID=299642 RepID=A0A8X6MPB7_NEPPI|nr:retrovirus-related Pol polyprotein from transposon 17.6 [Nephila pilipes]